MPNLTPVAAMPDGSETLSLFLPRGMGATLTLAQLRAYALGQPIGAGAPVAPVGRPAVTTLYGSEQVQVVQGSGWKVATVAQLATWATTGAAGPYSPSPSGGLGGFASVSDLDGSEAVSIVQAGGVKGFGLAALRAFITG